MTDTLERTETIEYPQTITTAPVKSRRALKVTLASIGTAALIAGGSWGGIAYANNVAAQNAHTVAVAQQHQVDAAIPGLTAQTTAIADESDTTTADQVVADEQAREAAVAAQQAAAAAAAAAKAANARAAGDVFGGNAPAGTPIPLHRDTDPNSGSYGQMVIENPDQFCASNGGTTNSAGVAVCS